MPDTGSTLTAIACLSSNGSPLVAWACMRYCASLVVVLSALCLAFPSQAQNKTAPTATPPSKPAPPADDAQLYRNAAFGFRYEIPYGWVDRTKEMQEGNAAAGKAEVLLAVFEHAPEAVADKINSAVVFATESAAAYPGLKKAEDYLGPLTELATAGGFKADGDPYPLEVESRQLLRADFIKPLNDKLTMRQCTLVLLTKGQIVSFTFIAGSEDDLDELMDSLHFAVAAKPAH
jgi:hypothetical protein